MAGKADRLAGSGLIDAGDLKHHAAGLDNGDPKFGAAFTGTHAGLGRMLGNGLIGEDLDPHLTATLGVTGQGDTGGQPGSVAIMPYSP